MKFIAINQTFRIEKWQGLGVQNLEFSQLWIKRYVFDDLIW